MKTKRSLSKAAVHGHPARLFNMKLSAIALMILLAAIFSVTAGLFLGSQEYKSNANDCEKRLYQKINGTENKILLTL